MVHIPCQASRTIYVPTNGLRVAILIQDHEHTHTHPILPPVNASIQDKNDYKECVRAAGPLKATVQTVENGEVVTYMSFLR